MGLTYQSVTDSGELLVNGQVVSSLAPIPVGGPLTNAELRAAVLLTGPEPSVKDPTPIGAAAQVVATTKYSVGAAMATEGRYYLRVRVKCDTVFTLVAWGGMGTFESLAGNLPTSGSEISGTTMSAQAATTADGRIYYLTVPANAYVLPLVYQATGGNAAVTITAVPFD